MPWASSSLPPPTVDQVDVTRSTVRDLATIPGTGNAVAAGNADYQPDGVDYPLQLDVVWRNY